VGGADAYQFDQDELESDSEVELVSDFLRELHDWGELWSEIEPGERVRAAHSLTEKIRGLEGQGLWVFGMRVPQPYRTLRGSVNLDVATVYIARESNPKILKDLGQAALARTHVS